MDSTQDATSNVPDNIPAPPSPQPVPKTDPLDNVQSPLIHRDVPNQNLTSPDINTSYMVQYMGKRARLTGKILEVHAEENFVVFQASDGVSIRVTFDADWDLWGTPTPFVIIVGTVIDEKTMHMETFINLGDTLDLGTVEATIRIIHDTRFRQVFFPK
ncbi:hypothetical protein VNI00_017094 [Paramarasmius palmivorus]|uniref:Uncharacterized protein n=1 Tax=Paramarasmius palmivorus TaxID=297713 RepID=A0AAW0B9T6_9AGAR